MALLRAARHKREMNSRGPRSTNPAKAVASSFSRWTSRRFVTIDCDDHTKSDDADRIVQWH